MELFCDEWMTQFCELWNEDSKIVEPLAKIKFNSRIAYGFLKDELVSTVHVNHCEKICVVTLDFRI